MFNRALNAYLKISEFCNKYLIRPIELRELFEEVHRLYSWSPLCSPVFPSGPPQITVSLPSSLNLSTQIPGYSPSGSSIHPRFPSCIANIITDYAEEKQLLEWINEYILYYTSNGLSINPAAVPFLEDGTYEKNKWWLSENPAAVYLLEIGLSYTDKWRVSKNPAATYLLETDVYKINWECLTSNPSAVHLLMSNLDKVSWVSLSRNPAIISSLEANLDKINWNYIAANPAAIYILESNTNRIIWSSIHENPAAIFLSEANPNKIAWVILPRNPAAIHILRDNRYNDLIMGNTAIFQSNKHDTYNLLVYGHIKTRFIKPYKLYSIIEALNRII